MANGCLDEYAATAFLNYINDDLPLLIDPEEIIYNKKIDDITKQMKSLSKGKNGELRLDRLSTVCTRLSLYFLTKKIDYKKIKGENLVSFLLLELLPKDLTMSLYKDLIKINDDELKSILRSKELANFILDQL